MATEMLVNVAAPTVSEEDFEDLLATDPLFIEYFNAFLELPAFPEPLSFNRETGGFEVKSPEKDQLVTEIKAAVRAGRHRKRIYRPVHNHAFSDIPLIPIDEQPYSVAKEINTSFTVQTLNKEQGIQWIKVERLPAFLQSDCYLEYRLAKVISQAQKAHDAPGFVSMKIYNAPPRVKHKKVIEEEEPEKDEGEDIMQKCYVSMGEASIKETEAWVTQAKLVLDTTTTSTQSGVVASTISPAPPKESREPRPTSGRPTSAASLGSRLSMQDSGVWSPTKSMFNSSSVDTSNYTNSIVSNDDADSMENKLKEVDFMATPRPSDNICVVLEEPEEGSVNKETSSKRVYATPTMENLYEEDSASDQTQDEKQDDREKEFTDTSNGEESDGKESTEKESANNGTSHKTSGAPAQVKPELTKPISNGPVIGGQDSDDDALLNSDDDYEDERDMFFRKKLAKPLSLLKRKGIEGFKKFLKGTSGEKNWLLWMDIERSKSIEHENDLLEYLAALRGRYQKTGAQFELPYATKTDLKLNEPSHWTREKLTSVQHKMAEPLVLYWSLRFMIKEKAKVKPEKNFLYHNQKLVSTKKQTFPNPPVADLLPLRPKSCMPRLRQDKQKIQIEDAFESAKSFKNFPLNIPKTSPLTGQHRTYQLPAMFQPPPDQKEEKEKQNAEERLKQKLPKELIKSKNPRPPSAPAALGSSRESTTSARQRRVQIEGAWDSMSDAGVRPPSARPSSVRPPSAGSGMGSRPQSAASKKSSNVSFGSHVSDFSGGRRMEGLLQALGNEKKSGAFIRKYLKEAGNDLWSNSLSFWEELQDYHKMFYAEVIDPFYLQTKAREIYSLYVVSVGKKSIQCNDDIQREVHYCLVPPYEELFDSAEEHVLTILFDAWSQAIITDMSTFEKVELFEEKRHLDTKSKYMVTLQRRGIIKDRPEEPEDESEDYKDPVYDDTLMEKVGEEFKDWSVEKLVHNRIELEHFRQFLADNYASMDLMCWMDIEAYKRLPHSDEKRRDLKGKDIKVKYFNKKYFFGPNSPAGKEGQEKIMAAGGGWGKLLEDKPPMACLLEAQKYVRERLEKKWLPLFLTQENFVERQHAVYGMDDAVEDVLIQKKKKSQAIWKMLEKKWVSSSKDIITFRKALLNPVASLQFRKFVSIKGDHYENDVLFWQEVQKYKDLCHLHSDRALVQQKTMAIIHCFIDSPIPPSLQIDVTQEMADKILERKMEATPYLFREAQLTVFRVLFNLWSDFCNFRTNLTEDKLMTTIERHRKKARAVEKKKLKELDEKKAKEEIKRKALGLPVGGEEEEYDPFAKAAAGSDDDDDGASMHDKGAVSWSYSKYMRAFDQEEVLNEVDEDTFSSLTGGDVTSSKEGSSEGGDDELPKCKGRKTSKDDMGSQISKSGGLGVKVPMSKASGRASSKASNK